MSCEGLRKFLQRLDSGYDHATEEEAKILSQQQRQQRIISALKERELREIRESARVSPNTPEGYRRAVRKRAMGQLPKRNK